MVLFPPIESPQEQAGQDQHSQPQENRLPIQLRADALRLFDVGEQKEQKRVASRWKVYQVFQERPSDIELQEVLLQSYLHYLNALRKRCDPHCP